MAQETFAITIEDNKVTMINAITLSDEIEKDEIKFETYIVKPIFVIKPPVLVDPPIGRITDKIKPSVAIRPLVGRITDKIIEMLRPEYKLAPKESLVKMKVLTYGNPSNHENKTSDENSKDCKAHTFKYMGRTCTIFIGDDCQHPEESE